MAEQAQARMSLQQFRRNKWLGHLEELKEYGRQELHFNVPQRYGPLGTWVKDQRRFYNDCRDALPRRFLFPFCSTFQTLYR